MKYLVAARTPIDSNVYKASYLDLDDAKNKKELEMRRVTEAAELPTAYEAGRYCNYALQIRERCSGFTKQFAG